MLCQKILKITLFILIIILAEINLISYTTQSGKSKETQSTNVIIQKLILASKNLIE